MDDLLYPPTTDAEIIAKMNRNKDNDLLKQIREAEKWMNNNSHKDYNFCPYCGKKL